MSRFRVSGVTDASVPFVDLGAGEYRLYFSSTNGSFAVKDSAGTVSYLGGMSAEVVEDLLGNTVFQDTATIDFVYDDTLNQMSWSVKTGSITTAMLAFDPATQTELDAVAAAKEDTANKATDFTVVNNVKFPTVQAVANAITAAVTGLWDDRGTYNASGNTYPASGGSGTAGAILKGDIWTISVQGTLNGETIHVGDTVRALVDTPGQTPANWATGNNNIGYVPENQANKSTDGTLAANSTTLYPSQSAVKTYADTKQAGSTRLTDLAAIDPTTQNVIASNGTTWIGRTFAQLKTSLSLTKADVGLNNVDNTSDLAKPISTATQTALDLKVTGPASATDGQIVLFDGTTGKLVKNSTVAAIKSLLAYVKGDIGLGNVDNTSDANKPVSTAQQTALNLKVDMANGALTPTVTPAYGNGKFGYSSDTGTLYFMNADANVVLDLGEESRIPIRNVSGVTLNNGDAVYATGYDSGTDRMTVAKAQANSAATMQVVGVMTETVANNANGYATVVGVVHNMVTNTFTDGQVLWLSSSVAGGLTATAPSGAGNYRVKVGIVKRSHATLGQVHVQVGVGIAEASASVAGFMTSADYSMLVNERKAWVNILDFGADNTGAVSITTALNNAVSFFAGAGGVIVFPPGSYLETSSPYILSANNITLWAPGGSNCTVLKTSNTTGDQIRFTGYGCTIQGFSIQGPGTGTTSNKTAGTGVDMQSTEGVVKDCSFAYHFDALRIGGTLVDVENLWVRYFKQSGIVVDQNSDHRITKVSMVNNAATLPTGAGIDVKQTASLVLEQLNIIASNIALRISPTIGVTVPSVKGTDCFFDTSAYGLLCDGAGSVLRCEFTNCWFSSMTVAGIALTPAASGQVDGITFVNCDIYNNVAGTTTGVNTNALVKKWKMSNCSIAGWTTGINLVAGTNHFPTITGNTIGAVSAFGVNTTGIAIGAGAYFGLVLQSNDVVDNTTAATFGAVTISSGSYNKYRIIDNAGINPRGTVATPAVPGSGVAVVNQTGFRVRAIYKYTVAGTGNGTIDGVAVVFPANATSYFERVLEPGTSVTSVGGTYTWTWVAM